MRGRISQGVALALALLAVAACQKKEPLTAAKAEQILRAFIVSRVPAYAEVPMHVWWNAQSPEDDFDARSVRTLHNLQRAGLVTVAESHENGTTSYVARVTPKGFPTLGTAPSARGPALRGLICYKVYDGIRNFERHPSDPTIGRAELLWHYTNATPLYPLFETKIDKPLDKAFASLVSFYYKDHQWRFDVTVNKTEAESSIQREMRRRPPAAAMMASLASSGKKPVSTTPAHARMRATTAENSSCVSRIRTASAPRMRRCG